ncbi:MAG: flavodoxin family protein [Clostridia bacterium]|nr:flavodoxin family protein [Clostridia bacterium]
MKVLLINGSPHAKGCTNRALEEIRDTLKEEGVDSEIIQVGNKDIRGCVSCGSCSRIGKCVFDDTVNETAEKLKEADGLVLASPVYYASPNGTLLAFADRLFYSNHSDLRMKVGAAVVSARRAGTTASFDVLNKYFSISQMPIVSSRYWNMVHGFTAEDVEKDKEGLQTMRILARNMAFMIKAIRAAKESIGLPENEGGAFTSFCDGL